MHAVTELTPKDLLDRSAIFADRALEFIAKCAPYTHVRFSLQPNAIDPVHRPFHLVNITLDHSKPGDPSPQPLRLATGEEVQPDFIDTEGPMTARINRDSATLRLPLVAVATQSFMRRFFALTDPTYESTHFCVYARNWQKQIDTLPEVMPDFSQARWKVTDLDDTEPELCIPQLAIGGGAVRVFMPGDYYINFTIASDEPVWKLREYTRLVLGRYEALPAEVDEALDPSKVANTFPHLSQKATNAGMIAYTESGAKGALDRQSVMKPGRFIRQFGYDHLTDEDVKCLAAKVTATTKIVYHHSKAREDYSHVYQTGPNSCMAYGPKSSRGTFEHTYVDGEFVHPTEVYAHPENNLELVWGEMGGEVISRTIINTKKKTYPRIYGKESVSRSKERIKDYLAELGYSQSDDALDGEKLLLLNPDGYPNAIICPYIDPSNRGVEIHDDHLVVDGYEKANHETGCLFLNGPDKAWTCACCGGQYDEDEDHWLDENGDQICEGCLDNHIYAFSIPDREGCYVHENNTVYRLLGTVTGELRYYDFVYEGHSSLSRYDLVELSSDLYGEPAAAECEQCVEYEGGGYVLMSDMDALNLFYDEDDGVARDIIDWAVVRDKDGNEQLVKRWQVNTDTHMEGISESSDICSHLPVFVPVAIEEAA